ncbi:ThiF family adenylyltransferase [Polyangium sp. 15x6]|uniref:HesA/MoeB/ThiF family protein n=1 Tax=Polyangium sp. 15x6 TaxID=3042687 RepID=UPI00249B9408|nr:ThiF family adenylyltransferase [Polyangium sp. 15x6]MDI3285132.1 ThiF family adenylyltransferase [Polyangium sp. 15x6]
MSGLPERFARHALVPGFRQDRLAAATVVIAGVGALGNVVAEALALAGVGKLVLCDPDVVATSNLSRAPLFRPADVGRPKVLAAKETLAALAPETVVSARRASLVSGVGLAEMRDASLVVGCLDSRAARMSLAGRAGLVRARWIDAATSAWGGEVRPFVDPDGPCYACALSPEERAKSDVPWSCMDPRRPAELGASAPVAGLVGAWASALAMRVIMGEPAATHAVVIDVLRGAAEPLVIERAPDCPLHAPIGGATRIPLGSDATVGALRAALGPEARPLAWSPLLQRLECPRGDHAEDAWGTRGTRDCPRCGTLMRARTTLLFEGAPEGAVLSDLGVAPREILAVLGRFGITYVELS